MRPYVAAIFPCIRVTVGCTLVKLTCSGGGELPGLQAPGLETSTDLFPKPNLLYLHVVAAVHLAQPAARCRLPDPLTLRHGPRFSVPPPQRRKPLRNARSRFRSVRKCEKQMSYGPLGQGEKPSVSPDHLRERNGPVGAGIEP